MFRGAAAVALAVGVAVAGGVAPTADAAEAGPVQLAVIAPIVSPAGTVGLLSSDALEVHTGPGGALTRQLDAVIDRPVTIAIDPMIIVSIRVLGVSAPPTAATWLSRLERAGNETFLLPYADSDVTLGIQAGSPLVIEPETFTFAIDPANFGPAVTPEASPTPGQTPTPTPTPSDDAEPPSLPTTEDLLSWPNSIEGLVWPAAGTVSEADLGVLTASGYSSVILSSGNVERDAASGPLVEVGGLSAIVTDDAVSERLAAAAGTSTPDGFQTSLPSLRASVASAGSAASSVVATLPRSVQRTGTNTAATISALQSSADVTLVPLSAALAGRLPAAAASLAPGSHSPEQIAEANRMLVAESADARFAPIVEDSTTISSPRRLALLALLSTQWAENPARWATGVENYVEASEDLRSSVEIVTTSPFTLLADNGALPIPVSNQLDQAVTVYLTIRPLTAQLAVTEVNVPVTIEPNSQARANVPVQAISNGSVQVVMTLSSADGSQVGQPAVTEINVQAGWETPVVLVIGGLVVVVFAVGLVRNILRRRRGSKDDPALVEPRDDD